MLLFARINMLLGPTELQSMSINVRAQQVPALWEPFDRQPIVLALVII